MTGPRNPELLQALKDYCTEVFGLWAAGGEVPRVVIQRPKIEGNSLSFVSETRINMLRLFTNERLFVPEFPHFREVEEAMRKDKAVATHLDTLVGTGDFAAQVQVQTILRQFLRELLVHKDRLRFDERRFRRAYKGMEDYFYRDRVIQRYLAPLENFTMEGNRVELGPDFRLVKLSTREREGLIAASQRSFPSPVPSLGTGWEKFGLETFLETPKHFSQLPAPIKVASSTQIANQNFERAVFALRLFKQGSFGYSGMWIEEVGWSPIGGRRGSWGLVTQAVLGPQYALSKNERVSFRRFWAEFHVFPTKGRPRLEMAIRRFNFAYGRVRQEDKLIDYTIAMEALLLRSGERGDLAYRLALRGSTLLGGGPGRRVENHDLLKAAYDRRSEIAHGGNVPKDVKLTGSKVPFAEFVEKLSVTVRETIQRFLVKGRHVKEEEVIAALDYAIVRRS
jgi:hypothetical protein